LNHFPLFAVMLRIKDPKRLPGGVRITVFNPSDRPPSLNLVQEQNAVPSNKENASTNADANKENPTTNTATKSSPTKSLDAARSEPRPLKHWSVATGQGFRRRVSSQFMSSESIDVHASHDAPAMKRESDGDWKRPVVFISFSVHTSSCLLSYYP
jgi:hypothetical protein